MPYILTKNIRKIAQDWKKWKGTTVRPLPEHEKIYEEHFKRIARRKSPRVLILGSTPELRTLTHKYKFKVTCVDRSLNYLSSNGIINQREYRTRDISTL